jgi:hypothetical protein
LHLSYLTERRVPQEPHKQPSPYQRDWYAKPYSVVPSGTGQDTSGIPRHSFASHPRYLIPTKDSPTGAEKVPTHYYMASDGRYYPTSFSRMDDPVTEAGKYQSAPLRSISPVVKVGIPHSKPPRTTSPVTTIEALRLKRPRTASPVTQPAYATPISSSSGPDGHSRISTGSVYGKHGATGTKLDPVGYYLASDYSLQTLQQRRIDSPKSKEIIQTKSPQPAGPVTEGAMVRPKRPRTDDSAAILGKLQPKPDDLGMFKFRDWGLGDARQPSASERLHTAVGCLPPTLGRAYQQLSHPDSLRLLKIFPGEESHPVRCRLETFRLRDSPPKYDALSYAWGASTKQRKIFCGNHMMNVTDNLHDALERLRYQGPGHTRLIWVDAICIDQSNDRERGHQVRLMRDIYRSAKEVVIWLGNDPKGHAIPAFSVVCAIANGHLQSKGSRIEASFTRPESDCTKLPWKSGTPPPESWLWHSVARLYDCDWNWRLWCVQEVAVATGATAIWGNAAIPWKWIGLAAARIRTNNWDVLLRYHLGGVYNAYLVYRISSHATDLPRLSLSFFELLGLTRQFEATRPEDRIFGLLGLPTNDSDPESGESFMTPNYTISYPEVYKCLALKVIENSKNLDILSSVQHGEELDINFPSWIPQWDRVFTQNIAFATCVASSTGFNACFGIGLDPGSPYCCRPIRKEDLAKNMEGVNEGFLKLQGFKLDVISSLVKENGSAGRSTNNILNRYSFDFLWGQMRESQERLVSTLTAGKDWYGMRLGDLSQPLADFRNALHKHNSSARLSLRPTLTGDAEKFMQAASNVCRGRRMFKTGQYPIGLGPAATRVGDVVCVLFGCQVPFILRPENDHYRLVGECYVYELMDGIGLLERGLEKTWFDIY